MSIQMNDVSICIPSMGRAAVLARNTALTIPPAWRKRTHVIVPHSERKSYKAEDLGFNIVTMPDKVVGIGHVRQYAVDNLPGRYLMMFDDDVRICTRKVVSDKTTTAIATDEEVSDCFDLLLGWLSKRLVAQVGIGASWMCHTKPAIVRNSMCGIANMLDKNIVRECKLRYDTFQLGEDSHMTLGLILQGYYVKVTYDYVLRQQKVNAEGGCSNYRTFEYQLENCQKFVDRYPDYAKLYYRSRDFQGLGVGVPNVRISWSRAARMGAIRRKKLK